MELQSKKVSKEERERRIKAEHELAGDRDLLDTPLEYLNDKEKEITEKCNQIIARICN